MKALDRKRPVLFSHPGCPPFAQQAARALYEKSLLSAYVTTFNYRRESGLGRALTKSFRLFYDNPEKELARREITELPRQMVVAYPIPELLRTLAAKSPLGPIVADLVWEKAELWFDRTVANRQLNGEETVYGYEHAALATFEKQKARGGKCIYDLPIAHHKLTAEILEPEMDRFPETLTDYDRHLRRLAPRRNTRKDDELALADHVIVASSFTKHSLLHIGYSEEKISVIPYGAPVVAAHAEPDKKSPFVFLSAGTQSVRKGVHYTIEAWRKIAPRNTSAELWLIGHMQLPQRLLDELPGKVIVRPSLPKAELGEVYKQANVLVFPSLVEGFGMVITEAMAHGLPVITTCNTAGPELIDHGKDGFIIPIRDVDQLASTMQWCLDHRADVVDIGRCAQLKSAQWQWSDYRAHLGSIVAEVLDQ